MLRSLSVGATGMIAQQNNLDIIANNVANINTNGYKKNICLCDNCFNQLYLSMQKAKRNNLKKLKGDN